MWEKSRNGETRLNYSDIVKELENATGFDLFRLRVAIDRMLDDPEKITALKGNLRTGQEVEYFLPEENRVIKAVVTGIKRTRVNVKNISDGRSWSIPYYYINIHGVDTDISGAGKHRGLGRNEVKVGDMVGFVDKTGQERHGKIIRLNTKSVTLDCGWRVGYGLLFKIFEQDNSVILQIDQTT